MTCIPFPRGVILCGCFEALFASVAGRRTSEVSLGGIAWMRYLQALCAVQAFLGVGIVCLGTQFGGLAASDIEAVIHTARGGIPAFECRRSDAHNLQLVARLWVFSKIQGHHQSGRISTSIGIPASR